MESFLWEVLEACSTFSHFYVDTAELGELVLLLKRQDAPAHKCVLEDERYYFPALPYVIAQDGQYIHNHRVCLLCGIDHRLASLHRYEGLV